MAEEADVAGGSGEAGVLLENLRILHGVEVRVHDHDSIELNGDVAAVRGDLVRVPLARGFESALLRRKHEVDRARRAARA